MRRFTASRTAIVLRPPLNLVRKEGFEPSRSFPHTSLNRACLPVPPLPHIWYRRRDSNSHNPDFKSGMSAACITPAFWSARRDLNPQLGFLPPVFETGASAVPPLADIFWCGRRDLNSHEVSPTGTSSQRGCHYATTANLVLPARLERALSSHLEVPFGP